MNTGSQNRIPEPLALGSVKEVQRARSEAACKDWSVKASPLSEEPSPKTVVCSVSSNLDLFLEHPRRLRARIPGLGRVSCILEKQETT